MFSTFLNSKWKPMGANGVQRANLAHFGEPALQSIRHSTEDMRLCRVRRWDHHFERVHHQFQSSRPLSPLPKLYLVPSAISERPKQNYKVIPQCAKVKPGPDQSALQPKSLSYFEAIVHLTANPPNVTTPGDRRVDSKF